ncbi:MAG: hypothetical protein R6X02_02810 [Enhygromyxa sp.]
MRVEAGTDPEPLGYGPGPHAALSTGYDSEPVSRPAPTPWTPPARELAAGFTPAQPQPPGPVPYNDDLIRVCKQLGELQGPSFEPDACLARYRIERVFRSIADWKTLAACLEAAEDEAAVEACLRASPRAFAPIAEYPRESEVCMHIFAITIVEQLGPEPMLDGERLQEFEPLLRECVDSLVDEERADRKPAEYVKMLECIERARTTAQAEVCE